MEDAVTSEEEDTDGLFFNRGERVNPMRKDNAAHIVSHELGTLRFVSLLLPLCVSVPKLYSISREA